MVIHGRSENAYPVEPRDTSARRGVTGEYRSTGSNSRGITVRDVSKQFLRITDLQFRERARQSLGTEREFLDRRIYRTNCHVLIRLSNLSNKLSCSYSKVIAHEGRAIRLRVSRALRIIGTKRRSCNRFSIYQKIMVELEITNGKEISPSIQLRKW